MQTPFPSPSPGPLPPAPGRARWARTALVAGLVTMGGLVAACSGGSSNGDQLPVTGSVAPQAPATSSTTSTLAPGTPGARPAISAFTVAAPPPCTGDQVVVDVTYATTDATTVAFAVDQVSVAGGPDAPVSGQHQVPVPCDGRSHTVLAVAVGPGGQAVASAAVMTTRA